MTVDDAVTAVRTAGGKISATYWRDIERGHGGRRGVRVPARASEGILAEMADAVGVTPDQLREAAAGHPGGESRALVVRKAARVLEEMRRRDARVIPLPIDPDDPARKRMAVEQILNVRLDPADFTVQELIARHPVEQAAMEIAKLFQTRAAHSGASQGTGRRGP